MNTTRANELVDEAIDHNIALTILVTSRHAAQIPVAIKALCDAQDDALRRLNNLLAGDDEEG